MPRLSKIGAAALAAFGWTSGSSVSASVLVVAGGGGGGADSTYGGGGWKGGGGGAGGYLEQSNRSLSPTATYTVTVGGGGSAGASAGASGGAGSNSVFDTSTALGGGAGAGSNGTTVANGNSGGSGGGAAGGQNGVPYGASTGTGGSATQGNSGGATGYGNAGGTSGYATAGGGGGAGGAGSNQVSSGGAGSGRANSISGSSVTYAAGGAVAGGVIGTTNTGNGGSGGSGNGAVGYAGGSGIVIISYAGAQQFGGGVVTSSGGNTIHTFTTSGTLSPITPLSASYLVVAGGGGGGGSAYSGGGGAGGLLSGSGLTIDPSSTYLVTVGAGGAGGAGGAFGVNGSNSVFLSITSTGGGGGSFGDGSGGTRTGNSGGSGGGGGSFGTPANTGSGGTGTSGQGNAGGNGGTDAVTYRSGGGGGGAGAVGANISSGAGGNGGAGTASSISGSSVTYAGGGGGAGNTSNGTGGSGGGGAAPSGTGTANTGGGGGGVGASGSGGAGGSGIVIISYPGSTQQMAGGTVTITGGNVIHTFTSSGYLTPIKYVSNSLRFRNSVSAYLSRTNTSSPTNAKIGTLSMWLKRGSLATGNSQYLIMSGTGTSNNTHFTLFFDTSNYLNAGQYSETPFTNTSAVFRDPSAWYHLVITYDSTQATASNRFKLYINNQLFTSSTTITQNNEWAILQANQLLNIGRHDGVGRYFDGYMTEINLIDGQALTPNSFGTFNSYGVWQPITYGGSYGTNGFYLPFTNKTSTTTLGYDFSPNGNNWTTNNISLTAGATYDSMTDVPTLTSATAANYCVLNPLQNNGATITNANLTMTGAASTAQVYGSIAMPSSGKWYFEATLSNSTNSSNGLAFGLASSSRIVGSALATAGTYALYSSSAAACYNNGSTQGSFPALVSTNTYAVAADIDNGKVWLGYWNGSSQSWFDSSGGTTGNPATGANATFTVTATGFFPFFQADSAAGGYTWSPTFGQRAFVGTPPTGFVALNTYNL